MKVQEALKTALSALEDCHEEHGVFYRTAIDELKSALSEIEKCEPVAYGVRLPDGRIDKSDEPFYFEDEIENKINNCIEGCTIAKLYTSPQPIEKCEPVYLIVSGADEIVVTKEKYDSWTSAKRISYTSPISKEWVGLTYKNKVDLRENTDWYNFPNDLIEATEAKLKQLNAGEKG